MIVDTLCTGSAVALTANATDTSFPTRNATTTEPTGTGVIDVSNNGNVTRNALRVEFHGTDTADQTFKCRILGWNKIPKGSSTYDLWKYIVLAEVTCTLGTKTGVASTPVNASQLIVDTITLATGYNSNVAVEVVSPTGQEPAHIVIDTKGCQKIEFIFDRNSSAVSCNAVYGGL